MLPVIGSTSVVVYDREIWVKGFSIWKGKGSLVFVSINTLGEKFIRDDDLGLGTNKIAPLRSVDKAFLKKFLGTLSAELYRFGIGEEIRQSACDIRVLITRV